MIGGSIAGYGLLNNTRKATADVTMGNLNIGSDNVTTADGTISDVEATVSGKWQYKLPGGDVDQWKVLLQVSDGDTWGIVGETSGSANYAQYNDSYTVSGSIIDTGLFDVSFFSAPGPGKQKTVELPLQVTFKVLNPDGNSLAISKITDTAKVVVAQEQIDASLYGELQGDGSVSIDT